MYIPNKEYAQILKCMPIVCVDLLILFDNKCLLLKRDNEPAKGQYWFPGGRVRKLETIEQAAIRIAKQETNLDCKFVKQISVEETIFDKNEAMNTDIHTVNICCHLTPENVVELNIDNLHSDFIWVNQQSISFHKAVNFPLSLIGFKLNDSKIEQ